MHSDSIVNAMFLIFTGAAILSTLVLFTRQSLLVAYLILGMIIGPWGLKFIADATVIKQIGDVGIIFLLFLLGLNLHPQNLLHMLKKVVVLTILSSLFFAVIGFLVCRAFGYGIEGSSVVGVAMMFSSTIIGLKLLPTTILHHQHTGEVMISVLLMQDLIAIIAILTVHGMGSGHLSFWTLVKIISALPVLLAFAFAFERYVLVKLLAKFDRTQEYIFILSVGWCLGIAELGTYIGLSDEIGAFIAGVALAASPISLYIAESLKPLRDFFLVLFFFAMGAAFNFTYLPQVIYPALILAALMLLIKPITFYLLLLRAGEEKLVAREVGVRLGQGSEFSLLIAAMAMQLALIDNTASYLVLTTTLITFIVSSYIVVLRYPTPIALSDRMRRD